MGVNGQVWPLTKFSLHHSPFQRFGYCRRRNRCPADASRINLDAGGYYAELLPVRERVSGPEHLGTLAARSGLARWTQEADGDADPGVK